MCAFVIPAALGQSGYSLPPEWESQQSLWLARCSGPQENLFSDMQCQIVKAVSPYETITLLVSQDSLRAIAFKQFTRYGIDTAKVRVITCSIENGAIRDAGPIFLKNKKSELALAHFRWTNYGWPKDVPAFMQDFVRGQINDSLAVQLHLPLIKSNVVNEGGALDVSDNCILGFKETALQRNPGMKLSQIEKEYLRVLGKKKMIWLNRFPVADKVVCGPKAGNCFGQGANGHVDEYARFMNDSTIVAALIDSSEKDADPISRIDYYILKENLALLQKATDERGRPFHIIILPAPKQSLYTDTFVIKRDSLTSDYGKCFYKHFKAGDTGVYIANVSYVNCIVTNKVVLIPQYWREGLPQGEKEKDEYVLNVYAALFPDRKIVPLNPMGANWNGGGMHCFSQEQPATRWPHR